MINSAANDVGDRFLAAYAVADSIMFGLDDFHPLNARPLTDFSPTGIDAREEILARFEAEARSLSAVDEGARTVADGLHAASVKSRLGSAYGWGMSEVHPVAEIMAALAMMPKDAEADRLLSSDRLAEASSCIAGFHLSLRAGVARGSVAPAVVVQKCIADVARHLGSGGMLDRLAEDARNSPRDAASVTALRGALADLGSFLSGDYLTRSAEVTAIGADGFGELAAAWLGRDVEIPVLLAQLRDELDSFQADAQRLAQRQGYPDPHGYAAFLQSSSTYSANDDLGGVFGSILESARAAVVSGEFVRSEFGAVANELQTAPDAPLDQLFYRWYGNRGVTFVPTSSPTRPRWLDSVSILHEGTPGLHVLHIALHQSEAITPFQRYFGGNRAWSKGWAVYVEQQASTLGILDTDEQLFAVAAMQVWRCSRALAELEFQVGRRDIRGALAAHRAASFVPASRVAEDGVVLCTSPGASLCYPLGAAQWREVARGHTKGADLRSDLLRRGPVGLAQLAETARVLGQALGLGR